MCRLYYLATICEKHLMTFSHRLSSLPLPRFGAQLGGSDLHAETQPPSGWEAPSTGRHWTKDGEGCCPVAMTTTGMYRPDCGGSCVQWERNPACYVRRGKQHEMGSHRWSCTITPPPAPRPNTISKHALTLWRQAMQIPSDDLQCFTYY